mmetsp:Transcript_32034/g.48308  ORF Transcript_32034/g.48308 Transcript_32034/m.48308 type:complete len:94 (-) Transcript_32034:882-1163(-)
MLLPHSEVLRKKCTGILRNLFLPMKVQPREERETESQKPQKPQKPHSEILKTSFPVALLDFNIPKAFASPSCENGSTSWSWGRTLPSSTQVAI